MLQGELDPRHLFNLILQVTSGGVPVTVKLTSATQIITALTNLNKGELKNANWIREDVALHYIGKSTKLGRECMELNLTHLTFIGRSFNRTFKSFRLPESNAVYQGWVYRQCLCQPRRYYRLSNPKKNWLRMPILWSRRWSLPYSLD